MTRGVGHRPVTSVSPALISTTNVLMTMTRVIRKTCRWRHDNGEAQQLRSCICCAHGVHACPLMQVIGDEAHTELVDKARWRIYGICLGANSYVSLCNKIAY